MTNQPETARYILEVADGSEGGRVVELSGERVSIGRAADNTLVLPAGRASQHHAEITREGDTWMLKDLGSTNGTRVEGKPIRRLPLESGDRIEIGRVVITFRDVSPPKTGAASAGAKSHTVITVGAILVALTVLGGVVGGILAASDPDEPEKSKPDKVVVKKPVPVDTHALLTKGLEKYDQGDLDGALVDYQAAVAADPKLAIGHNNIGMVYLDKSDLDKAEQHFRKALDIDRNFSEAHNNLAYLLRQQGQDEAAARAYEKFLALEPNTPDAEKIRAWIREVRNRTNAPAEKPELVTETAPPKKDPPQGTIVQHEEQPPAEPTEETIEKTEETVVPKEEQPAEQEPKKEPKEQAEQKEETNPPEEVTVTSDPPPKVERTLSPQAKKILNTPRPKMGDFYAKSLNTKMANFQKLRNQIEIVGIGDSRTNCGVAPEVFAESRNRDYPIAFNLSYTSSGIDTAKFLRDEYLVHVPNLKWVVWGVSPRLFNKYWRDNPANEIRQSPGHKFDKRHAAILWRPKDTPRIAAGELKGNSRTTALGRSHNTSQQRTSDPEVQRNWMQRVKPGRYNLSSTRWNNFERLISDWNRKGVRVLIFTPPIHDYLNDMDVVDDDGTPRTMNDELNKRYRRLEKKYPNLVFVDCNEVGDTSLQDGDYANQDHLNASGARKLTRILDAAMRKAEASGNLPGQAASTEDDNPDGTPRLTAQEKKIINRPRPTMGKFYARGFTHRMSDFRKMRGQIEIVVMGDSRAKWVRPERFSDPRNKEHPLVVNLGCATSGIDFVDLLKENYLVHVPKMKWAVWGVSPRLFNAYWRDRASEEVRGGPGLKFDRKYAHILWKPKVTELVTPKDLDRWSYERTEGPTGHQRRTQVDPADPKVQTKWLNNLPPGRFKFSEARWRKFEAIVQDWNRKGVKVLIFTPPINDYLKDTDVVDNDGTTKAAYQILVKRYADLAQRNPDGVIFLDLNKHGEGWFKDEDFYNEDHVNWRGAIKMTRMLDETIRAAGKK